MEWNHINNILKERKELSPDDPRILEKWAEIAIILSENIDETIEYLNNCNEEEIYWISEVFDDISEQTKSIKFIECIEKISEKYPNLDLEKDIFYARKALND